ncbi:hypothetical protein [Nocardioides sp. B-3]|uniref:hypothetical protein n=1 Tax=Nocardioides sp. B-3 TaxID=2895565 RepID=UPI00215204F8|nr:hypothetical protein [Nocardioides sp. B-3]UUZ60854.1 hypothetical protein LP418_09030 [Nocardioides sp. B-3]
MQVRSPWEEAKPSREAGVCVYLISGWETCVPGELTAWLPTSASNAAFESCPHDVRPLTHDRGRHLLSAIGRIHDDPDEAPWIGVACHPADAQPASVAAAPASLFDRHESLRCDYVPGSSGGVFARRLLPPGLVEFEAVSPGFHDTSAAVHRVLVRHLAATANPSARPFSGFVTVESEERVTLFAAFDRVTFDGYSMYSVADELPRLHRTFAAEDAPDPALALTASHLDHAAAERDFTGSLTATDPHLRPPASTARRVRGRPRTPCRVGGSPRGSVQPRHGVAARRRERRGRRFRPAVSRLGHVHRADLHRDAAPGHRRTGRPRTVDRAGDDVDPRALRRPPGLDRVVRRRCSPVVDVDPAADLRETATDVSAARSLSAPAGRIPLPVVGDLLGVSVEPGLVVSFMESTRTPGWREWRETEARGFLGHVPLSDQMHAWVNVLPSGTFLEALHPATPQCTARVATLAVTMRSALLSLIDPRRTLVPAPGASGEVRTSR